MRLLLPFLLAGGLFAQTAPNTVPVTATVNLPTNWAGVFATYGTKAGGSFSYATLLSGKGQIYSFTTYDESVVKSTTGGYVVQSSPRTGFATLFRNIGPVYLFVFGDAGTSTTGTNTGGAFGPGGMCLVRLGKTDWTIQGAVRYIKNTLPSLPDQTIYELGFGHIW